MDCAKVLYPILRAYQAFPLEVRLTGKPNSQYLEVSEKELRGEFDFSVSIEDMSISHRREKIKESYDRLVALSPFPEVRRRALITDFLLSNEIADPSEYMHPPPGPPADPVWENAQMEEGRPVPVNPLEDHNLHLAVHNQWIKSPRYQQIVQQNPVVSRLASEHIQMTITMQERRLAEQNNRQEPTRAGVAPSTQRGEQLASSTPVGGPTNVRGPMGA